MPWDGRKLLIPPASAGAKRLPPWGRPYPSAPASPGQPGSQKPSPCLPCSPLPIGDWRPEHPGDHFGHQTFVGQFAPVRGPSRTASTSLSVVKHRFKYLHRGVAVEPTLSFTSGDEPGQGRGGQGFMSLGLQPPGGELAPSTWPMIQLAACLGGVPQRHQSPRKSGPGPCPR